MDQYMNKNNPANQWAFSPSMYPSVITAGIHQTETGATISCDASLDDPELFKHIAETGSPTSFRGEIYSKAIADVAVTLVQAASKRSSTHTALTSIGERGYWLYVESVELPPMKNISVVPRPSSYGSTYIAMAVWCLRKVLRGLNDGTLRINGEKVAGIILPSALSSDVGVVAIRKAMLECGARCLAPYNNTPQTPLTKIASVVGSATIVLRFNR